MTSTSTPSPLARWLITLGHCRPPRGPTLPSRIQFPKLKAKFGRQRHLRRQPFWAHIRTEFGFDVVQVARGRFTSQAFHDFHRFEVSKPLLQRAFITTYGVPLDDVFPNLEHGHRQLPLLGQRLIPHMTRVAIVMKKDEILKEDPTMTRKRFLYRLKTSQYRHDFGRQYQRHQPWRNRILAFFLGILPKIGPLKTLDFRMPSATNRKRSICRASTTQPPNWARNLDACRLQNPATGEQGLRHRPRDQSRRNIPSPMSSYADLLGKLADHHFAQVTA